MRRYADAVEVRRGALEGAGEGPQQFLWRGRLWKVRAVLAHWVETGAWWQSTDVDAVLGAEEAAATGTGERGPTPLGDLLAEREFWRVEAGRPRPPAIAPDEGTERAITGVFDLSFDWADGRWTLVGCTD